MHSQLLVDEDCDPLGSFVQLNTVRLAKNMTLCAYVYVYGVCMVCVWCVYGVCELEEKVGGKGEYRSQSNQLLRYTRKCMI